MTRIEWIFTDGALGEGLRLSVCPDEQNLVSFQGRQVIEDLRSEWHQIGDLVGLGNKNEYCQIEFWEVLLKIEVPIDSNKYLKVLLREIEEFAILSAGPPHLWHS